MRSKTKEFLSTSASNPRIFELFQKSNWQGNTNKGQYNTSNKGTQIDGIILDDWRIKGMDNNLNTSRYENIIFVNNHHI